MQPAQLTAAHFSHYPAGARSLADAHLALIRRLPLAFVPGLLREVAAYDSCFPVERAALERQLSWLETLDDADFAECFVPFADIRMSSEQAGMDWAGQPLAFSEQMSAYLWSTHQIDAFRAAAMAYGRWLARSAPPAQLPVRRLGIVVVGQGVLSPQPNLFARLRPHGTLFTGVNPTNGLPALLRAVAERAQEHPAPYAHWYVDGGLLEPHPASVIGISYGALKPARENLFATIQKLVARPGMGPEALRDRIAELQPAELGLAGDPLLDNFLMKVLTEGSGTQIFSTTFAQWSAREVLRRAEPLTLLVRFAPRQRQRPMNELLTGDEATPQLDPAGSLVDADMAAYYQWINQGRLPGAAEDGFLAWHEGEGLAVAVAPGLPRGTESHGVLGMEALLQLVTGQVGALD